MIGQAFNIYINKVTVRLSVCLSVTFFPINSLQPWPQKLVHLCLNCRYEASILTRIKWHFGATEVLVLYKTPIMSP